MNPYFPEIQEDTLISPIIVIFVFFSKDNLILDTKKSSSKADAHITRKMSDKNIRIELSNTQGRKSGIFYRMSSLFS